MKKPPIIKRVMFSVVLFYTLHFAHCAVFAQGISSVELVNNASVYDGKIITYEGEVIGDVMQRGEYAWANLSDGKGAIGIWLDKALADSITYTGSYKSKGDLLEVTGTFRRACSQHGGDLDIHAESLRKISGGRQLKERLNPAKLNFVWILTGVLCLVLILRLFRSRQNKK